MVPLVLRASEDAEEAEEADEVNLGANRKGESNARGSNVCVCARVCAC